jgi:hypothetical protein
VAGDQGIVAGSPRPVAALTTATGNVDVVVFGTVISWRWIRTGKCSLAGAMADVDGAGHDHRGDDDDERGQETGTSSEGRHACNHSRENDRLVDHADAVMTTLGWSQAGFYRSLGELRLIGPLDLITFIF